jgi:hypothetical protein
MNAPTVSTLQQKFKLRCWARAKLYFEGEIDLQEAVDALQEWAQELGLVEQIGQDAVQAIITGEFGAGA